MKMSAFRCHITFISVCNRIGRCKYGNGERKKLFWSNCRNTGGEMSSPSNKFAKFVAEGDGKVYTLEEESRGDSGETACDKESGAAAEQSGGGTEEHNRPVGGKAHECRRTAQKLTQLSSSSCSI